MDPIPVKSIARCDFIKSALVDHLRRSTACTPSADDRGSSPINSLDYYCL